MIFFFGEKITMKYGANVVEMGHLIVTIVITASCAVQGASSRWLLLKKAPLRWQRVPPFAFNGLPHQSKSSCISRPPKHPRSFCDCLPASLKPKFIERNDRVPMVSGLVEDLTPRNCHRQSGRNLQGFCRWEKLRCECLRMGLLITADC